MKKHRISTTISQKHWALLNKHAEKFETHQKVLEYALENLDNDLKQGPALSPKEELWMRMGREIKWLCIFQKDAMKKLLEKADVSQFNELMDGQKPIEYVLEYFYQKPLKECSLKEVMEGIVITAEISNWFDTVTYADGGDHYTLKIIHYMGMNSSKMSSSMIVNLFRAYGVRTESKISENSVRIKIFKN